MTPEEHLDSIEYGANLCLDDDPEINTEAVKILQLVEIARNSEPAAVEKYIIELRVRLDRILYPNKKHGN